jgi:hypothetical protein
MAALTQPMLWLEVALIAFIVISVAINLQCTIAALRDANAAMSPTDRAATPMLARSLYLISEALNKLRLPELAAQPGFASIQAAIEPRMSHSDEATALTLAAAAPGGSQHAAWSQAHTQRSKCANVLQEWAALCEEAGGVPTAEQTVRCSVQLLLHQMVHSFAFVQES